MIKFYDTSSLIKKVNSLFDSNEIFVISSITLEELENIKTSSKKDNDIKYAARHLLQFMDLYPDRYQVIFFKPNDLKPILKSCFDITNDLKILSSAIAYNKHTEILFLTNDLNLKHIAKLFLSNVDSIKENEDSYTGYKNLYLNDEEIAEIYSPIPKNKYNLLTNEYAIMHNSDGEIVDKVCWNGTEYRPIKFGNFESKWFNVKPYKNDIEQVLLFDSLMNNKITMVRGRAGSGKTLISLGYLLQQLDRNRIDKIIIFCNTVATKDSAKLGFYPGTRDEKLLDSQIGNLLSSKLGSRFELERLINEEKIVLMPLSDCRGFDTSGMRAGIYISEAQNMTIDLMKLALQRIGEDCICIIDGDDRAQVDDIQYANGNNGMKRASKIFRGHSIYGEVELKTIHRSEIGRIADFM